MKLDRYLTGLLAATSIAFALPVEAHPRSPGAGQEAQGGTRMFRHLDLSAAQREQVCYLLEGEARVEVGEEKFDLRPGEACFFPADVMHKFTVKSERVRVMVIYAPPYLEKGARLAP